MAHLLVPASYGKYTPYHKQHGDDKGTYILCYGDIPRAVFLAVNYLHYLTFVFAILPGNAECSIAISIFFAVSQS